MTSSSRRILVVDDEEDIRVGIAEALREEGYDVAEASNGAEALASIENARPSLVFLDLAMPVTGGEEVLKRLRGMPGMSNLPVVIMTSKTNTTHKHPVLLKPLNITEVLKAAAAYA
jgi:CheY-like chemotaxis protein